MAESRSHESTVLALDQGGHATRAVVFDRAGQQITQAVVPIETRHPAVGWVEHDACGLLDSVYECLTQIAQQLGPADIARIQTAALCTQRSSVVCWSRSTGLALTPIISWQDVRAADFLQGFSLDEETVHAITGLRLSPHYGASKFRWALQKVSAVQAVLAINDLAMGPLSSYIVFNLTMGGTFATDPCNASRTLLWDMHQRDWSQELLDAFAIPRAVLPECYPNRANWGKIQVGETAVPLTVVTGDQSAVPFAFETTEPGQAFLTLGTGAFLQLPEAKPTQCDGLLNSVILQQDDKVHYALEATVNGAGGALSWLAQEYKQDEKRLIESLPAWLEQYAQNEPPLFLNAVGGLAAPYWNPTVHSQFVGQGDVAAQAVAVIESIVFLVCTNIEHMRACGKAINQIIAVGGLAELDGLLQRVAVLSELTIVRAANLEATAYGGARLADSALPAIPSDASFAPDPALKTDLNKRYQSWQKHMESIQSIN